MIQLVLGASGQVGSLLYQMLQGEGKCIGTSCHRSVPGLEPLDLFNPGAVTRLLRQVKPDVCYLPAAWTQMDRAETHPRPCMAVNVDGVREVANVLARQGGLLVYFSTDHVFGEGNRPWHEEDPTNPQSLYALTKVQAEQLVRHLLPQQHLILRPSWVFGPDPQKKNFLYRVVRTLQRGDRLTVPSDQLGNPTYGVELARTAIELTGKNARGTFHTVGPALLSRLAWAQTIARVFDLPETLIQGAPTAQLGSLAPRPLRAGLNRRRMLEVLGRDPFGPLDVVLRQCRESGCGTVTEDCLAACSS